MLNSLDHLVAINNVALDMDKSPKRRRLNIRFEKIWIIMNPFLDRNQDVFGYKGSKLEFQVLSLFHESKEYV